jgi:hypothetical protein
MEGGLPRLLMSLEGCAGLQIKKKHMQEQVQSSFF